MDQEKFDQHLMDYLFDELDEVTRAAMRRKLDADAACREVEAGLRATLELAELPLEEPSLDLEDRILAAAAQAERGEPWYLKLLRSLSWAGSHAMRPQLAMAVILVLLLGSSMLLLRARPGSMVGAPAGTPVAGKDPATQPREAPPSATLAPDAEQSVAAGSPGAAASAGAANAGDAPGATPLAAGAEPKPRAVADANGPAAPPVGGQAAQGATEGPAEAAFDDALRDYKAGNNVDAQRRFAEVNRAGGANAPQAALYEARAARAGSGCKAAVALYDRVRQRYGNGGVGADASWEQADCLRQLGQEAEARKLLVKLSENPEYNARAVNELANSGQAASTGGSAVGAKRQQANAAPAPASKRAADRGASAEGF